LQPLSDKCIPAALLIRQMPRSFASLSSPL